VLIFEVQFGSKTLPIFEVQFGSKTLPISRFTLALLGLEEEGRLDSEDFGPLLRDLRRYGAGLIADGIEQGNPPFITWGPVIV